MEEKLLTLEIPLNEELYREQLKKFFYHRWKKGLGEIKRGIIYVSVMLILTLLSYFGKGEISTLYIILTTILATILYVQLFQFFNNKKMYFRKVDKTLKECKEFNNIGFLELTENDIFFKNKFIEQKSIWKKTNFEFVDNLFIVNFENSLQSFLFEEKEIGQDNFNKLISIVKMYSNEKK